ncbi:hypothetical protein LX97_02330 [Nonlabens dokdonensis]|jgi:hypothetical protein|uniref:Secreted protein n=2 Tax=Nonlabens dokdonensis TaxID=328515 RepID=L7WBI6_NONDD|nr:hypothetical protein [Nonlabens dokdonensis]AGC77469.1 secreted protein [Nonlabens dokdonensis DSW-6]PZX39970.1 hypothetical protein LX97_02330 [Nonlabens dokdonensis]
MRKPFYIFFLVLLISSCTTKNEITKTNQNQTNCPDDGSCITTIIEDTQVIVKVDEYGYSYQSLEKKEGIRTLKFEYNRNQEIKLADDFYTEIIYIQIDKSIKSLSLKDESLKEAGVLYGRLCYCRGATGFYQINKGDLNLLKTDHGYDVSLVFKVNEVPQVITVVNASFNF